MKSTVNYYFKRQIVVRKTKNTNLIDWISFVNVNLVPT